MNLSLLIYQSRRWIIFAILPAMLITVLDYAYNSRQPKQYVTSTTLYVQVADASSTSSTDVYTSQALIPTYTAMMTSPVITAEANQALAHEYPGYNVAAHGLSVGAAGPAASSPNTQLLQISLTDTDPLRDKVAADTVAQVFIRKLDIIASARFKGSQKNIDNQLRQEQTNIQLVSQRITSYKGSQPGLDSLKAELNAYSSMYQSLLLSSQQFGVSKDTALNGVRIFSPAYVPTSPTGPHPTRGAVLAGFLALALCVGLLFAYDYFDDSPRTPEEIEEIVGAPILGTVEEFSGKDGNGLVTAHHSRSPVSEAYRIIRTNIQYLDVDHKLHSLVVTSSSPSEGKSTTISNLANIFAEAGSRVALIDADLRRPSLHRYFTAARGEGLSNLLIGDDQLNGYGQPVSNHKNFILVSSGPLPSRPADMLGSNRMRSVVEHIQANCDIVLLDSPPVLAVTDAAILATVADGVILVVDPAKSKRRDLKRSREAIEAVGGKIVGIVINRINKRENAYYYYYYQHHYGYGYKYGYTYGAQPPAPSNGSANELEPGPTETQPVTRG